MADAHPGSDPPAGEAGTVGREAAGESKAVRFTTDLSTFAQHDPPAATSFFQTFFTFVSAGRGRRPVSDEVVQAIVALRERQEQRALSQFRLLLTCACVMGLATLATLAMLIFLLRDCVELVKVVFEGVGVLASYEVFGAGGYAIGRTRKGPPPREP